MLLTRSLLQPISLSIPPSLLLSIPLSLSSLPCSMSVTAGPLEMALSSVTWLRVWPPHYRIHFLQTKISFQFQLFFARMWVHMVVFVCPNEPPCVYLCTTVRHKRMCIHFVCMCMCCVHVYAHTFSAISFLLNDSMLTRSDKRDWK